MSYHMIVYPIYKKATSKYPSHHKLSSMVIITSIRINELSASVCPGNGNNGVYFELLNFDNIICSIPHALYNVVSFSIIVDILYPFLFAFGNLLLVFFFVIPTFIKFSLSTLHSKQSTKYKCFIP